MLLEEVAKHHRVDVKSLQDKSNYQHFSRARRDFCIKGLQAGIGKAALAIVLRRDITTIAYHQRPDMRRRKSAQGTEWWKRKQERRSHVSRETGESHAGI